MSPSSPAEPGAGTSRRNRRFLWLTAAAVSLILLGLGAVWLVPRISGGLLSSASTPSVDPVATYLVQPADLDQVLEGTTWTAASTATVIEGATPRAKCFAPASEQTPAPSDTMVRTFAPSTGEAGGILHQVTEYATPEEATAAYATQLDSLAACTGTTGWVSTGLAMTGLGDEAVGVQLEVQDAEVEQHAIVLWRTGTRVNVLDATQPGEPVDIAAFTGVLTGVATRQCAASGTCPSAVEPTATLPPAANPAGWLASVDLPRITAGAGQWRGTDPATTITVAGTRCEAIEFGTAAGATAIEQRTYVLQEDTNAPEGFGVDEVRYTFSTPEEATAFATSLTTNYETCAERTQTAEVTRTADITAEAHTGVIWVVIRQTDRDAGTARFRTAVVTSGNRVAYLMLNPSNTFDYSDAQWQSVASRAGERLTQAR